MPDIAITRHWAFVFQWRNNELYFPLLDHLYNDQKWASIPMSKDILNVDVGLSPNSYTDFVNHMYWTDYSFENRMLDIAKERGTITNSLYQKYHSTPSVRGYPKIAKTKKTRPNVIRVS